MKKDMFTAVMKTIGSTQDEKTRNIIDGTLKVMNETATRNAAASLSKALESFIQAKTAHTGNMLKLNDIDAAITRSEKERQNALEESAEAVQSWRTRFRELRGVMTPEMKAEHSQRTASRELAEEFTGLISDLKDDKSRTMLAACTTGNEYVCAHLRAFSVYAQNEWAVEMKNISPALARTFALRLRELEMNGEEHPHKILYQELGEQVLTQSRFYDFNMEQEPVISQLGLTRPALTGVDMDLYKSPLRRMSKGAGLAAKSKAQGVKP
ncbi:MAG TPA: capsid protein [Scandinavium sp.]|uniref:capsid protein n=1 Tax=Scandinavium sp. TaxID=2830653 RepID=UPI002E2EF0FD|nr:capsid protein [Scandinavium sp.]HEX4502971.1 capsid protein [Scandinavium sp.]